MKDTRLKSISEVTVNIAIGYSINFTSNMFILPAFGLPFNFWSFHGIGLIYTFISVGRQYFLRRLFEKFDPRANLYTLLKKFFGDKK